MIEINQLAEKIKLNKSVAIFIHIRPDGDTIGSAVGLSLALKKIGIIAQIFSQDKIPNRFNYLCGVDEIKTNFEGKFDAVIAIDCADLTRIGDNANLFIDGKNTFNIDHHISNTRFAKVNYVVEKASNCENIFDLINNLNVEIDKDIANALATGLITDTGNLKHKNTTSDTILSLSKLVKFGANITQIVYENFTSQTKERAYLFGIVMSKIKYYLNGKLCIITIRREDIVKSGANNDDTEGFIDFIMGIIGVEVGVCLMELENGKFKASFRSKSTDVNEIANIFGGGGHVLASGCQFSCEYEEILDKLIYAVKSHMAE